MQPADSKSDMLALDGVSPHPSPQLWNSVESAQTSGSGPAPALRREKGFFPTLVEGFSHVVSGSQHSYLWPALWLRRWFTAEVTSLFWTDLHPTPKCIL